MFAGFAQKNINPSLPVELEGLQREKPASAIHDDLYVRAVMIRDGRRRLLIVSYDLLFLDTDRWELLNQRLGAALGLRPEEVLTNMSHTHAGPRVSRWAYGGRPDEAYLDAVEAASIAAAQEAQERSVAVTATTGETSAPIPVSRRRYDRETGTTHFLPTADEPVYEWIPFLCLRDQGGGIVALIFSVSCHPSMMYDSFVSADYPGPAVRLLNKRFNTDGAMFLQGVGGDSKPRPIAFPEGWKRGDWDDVEAAGRMAADAVGAALEAGNVRPVPAGALRTASASTTLPLRPPPAAAELDAIIYDGSKRPANRLWASEMFYRLTLNHSLPAAVPLTLRAASLGGVFRIIAIPGEVVAEHGHLVRDLFSAGVTMPLGYTNGTPIYVPCDRQLPRGGYEVVSAWEYHWPSQLAPGIDNRIRDAVKAMIPALA